MTHRLHPTIHREVLNQIATQWSEINASRFRGAMRAPTFALEDVEVHGDWRPRVRQIRLSTRLVIERPWLEVLEVLAHEMAHQYVSEVLGVNDETAHGPAFARVCRDHGIDARAASPARVAEEQSVVARAQKLLAMAERGTEHEAHAALQAAMRLMARHGLSEAEVKPQGPTLTARQLTPVRARAPVHERWLAGVVSRHFDTPVITRSGFDVTRGVEGTTMEVVGTLEQVELFEYVFSYVLRVADRLWRDHLASGAANPRDRVAYLQGVVHGFDKKLEAEATALQREGLVLRAPPEVFDWYDRRYPLRRSRRTTSRSWSEASKAGVTAGEGIQVRSAIREQPGRRALSDRGATD